MKTLKAIGRFGLKILVLLALAVGRLIISMAVLAAILIVLINDCRGRIEQMNQVSEEEAAEQ